MKDEDIHQLLKEMDALVAEVLECMRVRYALFKMLTDDIRTSIFNRNPIPCVDDYLKNMTLVKQEMKASMCSLNALIEVYSTMQRDKEDRKKKLEDLKSEKKSIKKKAKKPVKKKKKKEEEK